MNRTEREAAVRLRLAEVRAAKATPAGRLKARRSSLAFLMLFPTILAPCLAVVLAQSDAFVDRALFGVRGTQIVLLLALLAMVAAWVEGRRERLRARTLELALGALAVAALLIVAVIVGLVFPSAGAELGSAALLGTLLYGLVVTGVLLWRARATMVERRS